MTAEGFFQLSLPDQPVRPEAGPYIPFAPPEGPDLFWAVRPVRNVVKRGEKSVGFALFACYRRPKDQPGHPDCYLARVHSRPEDVSWPSVPRGGVAESAPARQIAATGAWRTETPIEAPSTPPHSATAAAGEPTLAELAERPQAYLNREVTLSGFASLCEYFSAEFRDGQKRYYCVRLTDGARRVFVYAYFTKRGNQALQDTLGRGESKLRVRAVLRHARPAEGLDATAREYLAHGLSWELEKPRE
jgi:hypothetical protein